MKKNMNKYSNNWGKKNKWFGEDQYKTYYAFDIHTLLMKNNIDPESKSYYKIIDAFMDHYDEIQKEKRKKIKLTPDQIKIAKRLGVPLKKWVENK